MAPKAIWLLLVVVSFVCSNSKLSEANLDPNDVISRGEELEMEKELKLLNKPPIKTFHTEEGDIIDCIDINKQPALDHPLLKNHKVQIRPSTYPVDWSRRSSKLKSHDNLLINNTKRKDCPKGSVPIRRTLKNDLIRLRSSNNISKQQNSQKDSTTGAITFPSNKNVVSLALKEGKNYYGATAFMSIYNLSVARDQSSSVNLWIIGGPQEAPNAILAGWQVNPAVSGDSRTRLFVYWTADGGSKTGCYNMLCRGFVQIDPRFTPDLPINPASTYRGQQNDFLFIVYQDRPSGNWILLVDETKTTIGYWPKELFTHLGDGAQQVGWGGIAAAALSNGISPPLGNGHIPNGEYDEACYFRQINYIDGDNKGSSPTQVDTISYVSNHDCYGLSNNLNCGQPSMFYCFTFGGPGGNNCRA